jgi:monothiol bacilliredoxin
MGLPYRNSAGKLHQYLLLPSLCVNQTDKLLSNHPNSGSETMENHFVKITDTKSFEQLASRSKDRPIVIFKHSLTCPISAAAYEQMAEFDGEVALIEVQRARELSAEIENRLGVEHESPQVIVLRNGQVVWNASHFRVTADAVADAVRAAGDKSQ